MEDPTFWTMPAPSWPKTAGKRSGMVSSLASLRSVRQIPVALMRIWHSSSRSLSSSSMSLSLNGDSAEVITMACVRISKRWELWLRIPVGWRTQ